jgi:ABC-type ATPase with predicted acetyltransferase domain
MRLEAETVWPEGAPSEKARAVMRMFGIDMERLREPVRHKVEVEVRAGQVCFITGPSGAGKTLLMRRLYTATRAPKVWLDDIPLPADRAVIDCMDRPPVDSLRVLARAGLAEVFCVLNRPAMLSDGQKWRFRLARAMDSNARWIFADEFCSTLDRVTAGVIAWNVRKWAWKSGVRFVLGSCHDDILADLRPDIVVVKHLNGPADIISATVQGRRTHSGT